MAHWDETRNRRWAEMMRKLAVPDCESIIQRFEATGDLADLASFFERLKPQVETSENQHRS